MVINSHFLCRLDLIFPRPNNLVSGKEVSRLTENCPASSSSRRLDYSLITEVLGDLSFRYYRKRLDSQVHMLILTVTFKRISGKKVTLCCHKLI